MAVVNIICKTALGSFSGRSTVEDLTPSEMEDEVTRIIALIQMKGSIKIYDLSGNLTVIASGVVARSVIHFVKDIA
jgi:hypothetical protein